jgi:MFS family permease
MTSHFKLYCENEYKRPLAISVMYLGVVIGNLVMGALGDIKGRRYTILLSWFIGSLCVLGITIA